MIKTETHKCPECGARLNLPPATDKTYTTPCRYCGAQITIQLAQPTASTASTASPAVYNFNGNGPSAFKIQMGVWVWLIIVFTFSFGGFGLWRWLKVKVSSNPFPMECGINEELTIEDKTVEFNGTLINAKINCKLRIKNSRLKGTTIIKADGMSTLVIENSTLEAKQNVIDTKGSTTIEISNKSSLKSDTVAIQTGGSSKISINQSSIEGTKNAIATKLGGDEIKIENSSTLKSNDVVLKIVHGKVHIQDSKLIGKSAIADSNYSTFEVESSALEVTRGTLFTGERFELAFDGTSTLKSSAVVLKVPEYSKVQLQNMKLDLDQPFVQLGDHATLQIKNSKIKSKANLIDAENYSEITMQNTSIDNKSPILSAGNNMKLKISDASILKSSMIAIKAGTYSNVSIKDSQVTGEPTALETGPNCTALFVKSKIMGAKKTGPNSNIDER